MKMHSNVGVAAREDSYLSANRIAFPHVPLHIPAHGADVLVQSSMTQAEIARRRILVRLGLEGLTTTAYLDIEAGHRGHAELQRHPGRFVVDGLDIEAPAGVYHPTPESSSMLFVRNIAAMGLTPPRRALEIGTGCGAIALTIANRWPAEVTATDISDTALETARANARRNALSLRLVKSDLFAAVTGRDFDLVVFNTPLIDKAPEDDLERESLCDPGGHILHGYLSGLPAMLAAGGVGLFGLCCNTAYEAIDEIDLNLKVVGLELIGGGFWRAVVAARVKPPA
jgi:methylase of polypeptide subunit release factors